MQPVSENPDYAALLRQLQGLWIGNGLESQIGGGLPDQQFYYVSTLAFDISSLQIVPFAQYPSPKTYQTIRYTERVTAATHPDDPAVILTTLDLKSKLNFSMVHEETGIYGVGLTE